MDSSAELAGLPQMFRYRDAMRAGLSHRRLYGLRDAGVVEHVGRGLFRRVDAVLADLDLLEVAARSPVATLCLATGLARHDLTDLIPARIDVALPRGHRLPAVQVPVDWHVFAAVTFEIGREIMPVDDQVSIGLYSAERCIVDAFRLRHREGPEFGYEALRRWLRRPGARPGDLLRMARRFRGTEPVIRAALDALL